MSLFSQSGDLFLFEWVLQFRFVMIVDEVNCHLTPQIER